MQKTLVSILLICIGGICIMGLAGVGILLAFLTAAERLLDFFESMFDIF